MTTKTERDELFKAIRLRGKVCKDDIEAHGARMLADVEAQLAARYPDNHEAWADVVESAKKVIKDADDAVAIKCRELGVPEEFRPRISVNWWSRGENAIKDRRNELRKVAQTEIVARIKTAKSTVDRNVASFMLQLTTDAMETDEARRLLAAMPSVEDLMPPVTMELLQPVKATSMLECDGLF